MPNGSRRALCIGVSSFAPVGAADEDEPDLVLFGNLDYAAEYTAELATALRTAGYDVDLVVDSGVLKARDLGERVESHLSSDGVAVVHVLSHGQYTADGGVYVVGSDATRLKETRVEEWRISVNDGESTPMTLFLLDFCHAGAANRLWQPPAAGSREKAWVIAATGAAEPAYGGRLTRAAASVIRSITAGEVDLAETLRTVSFGVLFERIGQEVHALAAREDGHRQDPRATPVEGGVLPELPFFDNPHYDPNPITQVSHAVAAAAAPFLDPILDADHFRGRAAGQCLRR